MIIELLYIMGITVEASSGAISAGRKDMDFFGVILIANVAAFGGGTLRDLLMGMHPLVWVAHPVYIYMTTASALFTVLLVRHIVRMNQLFLMLDALGLGTFCVLGFDKAYAMHLPIPICILMGLFTGIGGGLARDILSNQVPLVLRGEIYAIATLPGLLLLAALYYFEINFAHTLQLIVCVGMIFLVRAAAIIWSIKAFKFSTLAEL